MSYIMLMFNAARNTKVKCKEHSMASKQLFGILNRSFKKVNDVINLWDCRS